MPYTASIAHGRDANADLDTIPPRHPYPYADAYEERYSDAYSHSYAHANADECDDGDADGDTDVPVPDAVPIR